MSSPVLANVAEILKQIQKANPQCHLPQNVQIGQGPGVTQHNSVLLSGTTSSVSAVHSRSDQGRVHYSYKVKIINPAKKSDVIV